MKKVILIFMVILYSCTPTLYEHNESQIIKAKERWIGKEVGEMLMYWGPPDLKRNDGDGGRIYTYKRNNGYITWVTNFYVKPSGNIYHLTAHSQ